MDTGISADEACRNHVLTEDDFARMCNPDGSLKNHPGTTTFTLKDGPSRSLTVNNNIMFASAAALAIVVACTVVLLIRRGRKKK